MPQASVVPGKTPVSRTDHALMMVDFQPQMAFATVSIDGTTLRNDVALVANAARVFGVPPVLTTVAAKPFSGLISDEIKSAFVGVNILHRTTMNCWEDQRVVDAVNRLHCGHVVICGLWTSVCIVDPVLSALDQGFEVYVIADACGDVSKEAHGRALERMVQLGARPMTSLQYLLELQRDWARAETAGKATDVALFHGGAYGLSTSCAAKMIGHAEVA
jgi:nicotinamidase-related amidase